MEEFVLTNNPRVRDRLSPLYPVRFVETSFEGLLKAARDLVHQGHKLRTHPLSGSIKPNETPYKSLLLTERAGPLDLESLELIEQGILACEKFNVKFPAMTGQIRDDFQLLDYTLILSALENGRA